jgi:hypothetical protein
MLIKMTSALIILLINSGIANPQFFESVEKEAERILISLSEGDSLNHSELTELNDLLSSEIGTEVSEPFPGINQKSIDSLKNHLLEFESLAKNISVDSAYVLFNDWYLHFQNIFYEYSKQKFLSSSKQKILFFSTSMSCYCTLKMSREQTVELLKFISENKNQYDYWIIDSYWYNELQIEYETLFAPSVIVFNANNEVLYKIEYDEKMLALLTSFLNNESKAQGF